MTIKSNLVRILALTVVAEAALAAFLLFDRLGDGDGNGGLPGPVLTEASQALALQAEDPAGAPPPEGDADEEGPASGVLVRLINDFRVESGLRPLYVEPALSAAASAYCGVIAPISWKSHVDPEGRDWSERAAASGYEGLGIVENLAWGYPTPEDVFAAWRSSEADRANLLNGLVNGVGVAHCTLDSGEYSDWWVYTAGIGDAR